MSRRCVVAVMLVSMFIVILCGTCWAQVARIETVDEKDAAGRLKEVYHRLLEADLAIKTGRYDSELALNILAAELCLSGNQAVRSGR